MSRFSKLEWEPEKSSSEKKLGDVLPIESGETETKQEGEIYDYYFYLKKAEQLFYKGDYRNSLRQYSRALQMENSQIEPWIGQVLCLIYLNQLREADLWIARGLELFPENSLILSLRGLVYAINGMMKRAISTSDYALTLKSGNNPLIWVIRGEILLLADNKNSVFCFEKAIEITNKADWQTPMLIGMIYYKNKYYTQASQFFQKACSINLSHYYLWYCLGNSYKKLGFIQKSIEAFKRSVELKQDFKEGNTALHSITHTSIIKHILILPLLPFRIIKNYFVGKKINKHH